MKTLNQIKKKIKNLTSTLIKKADKKGLYENFGDKEMKILSEYIGDIWGYNCQDRIEIMKIENAFIEWCYNYTGEK